MSWKTEPYIHTVMERMDHPLHKLHTAIPTKTTPQEHTAIPMKITLREYTAIITRATLRERTVIPMREGTAIRTTRSR